MRADALITLNVVQPVRRLFPPKGRRVPILMYHSISNREESGHPYFRTVTSQDAFERQMRYLDENGYTAVRIGEALEYLDGTRELPRQPVVITFDDGYADFESAAYPVLAQYGFTAIVYLPTAFIGEIGGWFKECGCLTWNQVRELHGLGIEFGSHTVNHPKLVELSAKAVEEEVRRSKEEIEQRIGSGITSFAYPFAFPESQKPFRGMLRGVLEDAGYENGTCTTIGVASAEDDRMFLMRLPMNGLDDGRLFEAKLKGWYDWLGGLQYGKKLIASGIRRNSAEGRDICFERSRR